MLKWIEATGRSEEAAIQNALAQLGLDRDSVSVEVLERARNGFLGFGSSPAKVKVTYEVSQEEAPVSRWRRSAPAPRPPKPAATPARPAEAAPQGTGQSRGPGFPCARSQAGGPGGANPRLSLRPAGPHGGRGRCPRPPKGTMGFCDPGGLRRRPSATGETLDAIQQLTNYAVNRGRTHRVRIHIDAEHYRAKREESLKRLANKVAVKVVKYRRNITLEPMNAYERHVIHETLQDYPDVITYSTGTEPNRRTVVGPSPGASTHIDLKRRRRTVLHRRFAFKRPSGPAVKEGLP
ncbi:MAG: R3H domain-containing nucleic acid-binding protein [Evtepia gabavorous]